MSRLRVNSIKPISGTNVSVSGSLVVTGNVTAEEFITERVSTSIIYKSGSTKFGDTADDIHEMTGTLKLTGSAIITSNLELGAIANVETYVSVATASILVNETAITNNSASLASSITTVQSNLNSASSSLASSITTVQSNLNSASSSLASTITTLTSDTSASDAALDTRVTIAESHLDNLHTFTGSLNDTYATDAELSAVSGALALAVNTSVAGLNDATGSYALAADLTVATGSINVNETNIGLLTALTGSLVSTQTAYNTASGSYITSASLAADYVSRAELKAIVTGSVDFAAFQTNILSL